MLTKEEFIKGNEKELAVEFFNSDLSKSEFLNKKYEEYALKARVKGIKAGDVLTTVLPEVQSVDLGKIVKVTKKYVRVEAQIYSADNKAISKAIVTIPTKNLSNYFGI